MNNILGMILGMLMPGVNIGSLLQSFGGGRGGAANMDGLTAMMNMQMYNARRELPMVTDQTVINGAFEKILDRLGMNPYTSIGQGVTQGLGSLYHLAPDLIGSIIGVPNAAGFYRPLANGASGIGSAAGYGMTNMFNPYSVMAAHRRAMDIGKMIYNLGVNKEGGYNLEFSHGLNASEMGIMSQRLLSSGIAYREHRIDENGRFVETGRQLDFDRDSEDFKKNIKNLGSKFKEAASMLSKVTGSVKDAVNLMDNMAGGNFLGGTAQQASDIANRARKLATAIRVSSAMAGISPQEAYGNMKNMGSILPASLGINIEMSNASGFSNNMRDLAEIATLAYTGWAANNPGASQAERERALMAANGRTAAYAKSPAYAMAAAVAAYSDMFTPEQLDDVKNRFAGNHPETALPIINSVIGANRMQQIFNDPRVKVATIDRAARRNKDLFRDLNFIGVSTNLEQAELAGIREDLETTFFDQDKKVYETAGKSTGEMERSRREARRRYLADIAKNSDRMGLTDARIKEMNDDQLYRAVLDNSGIDAGELDRGMMKAEIEEQKRNIEGRKMTGDEIDMARKNLIKEVEGGNIGKDRAEEIKKRINDGEDIGLLREEYIRSAGMDSKEADRVRKAVGAGKMSEGEINAELRRLRDAEKSLSGDYTTEERLRAINEKARRNRESHFGELEGYVAKGMKGKTIKEAFKGFEEKVSGMREGGLLDFGKDEDADLETMYAEAAKAMMDDVFDGNFGNLKDDKLKALQDKFAKKMLEDLRSGKKTMGESLQESLESLTPEEKAAIGNNEAIGYYKDRVKDKSIESVLNQENFFAKAAGVANKRGGNVGFTDYQNLSDIALGKMGDRTDKDVSKLMRESMERLGLYSGTEDDFAGKARSSIEDIISGDGVGLSMSDDEMKAISSSAMEKYNGPGGGDYKRATVEAIREQANKKGIDPRKKKELLDAAGRLEKMNASEFSKSMYGNVLSQIQKTGIKSMDPYYAAVGAGDQNSSILAIGAAIALNNGMNMQGPNYGEGAEDTLSSTDRAIASRNQWLTNALGVGHASFAKEEIAKSKKLITGMKDLLGGQGIDRDLLEKSFGNGNEAKEAQDEIKKKLSNTKLGAEKGWNLISTVAGSTIGGVKGIDVLFGGEEAMKNAEENAKKKGISIDEDMLNISRKSAQMDSPTYKIMSDIGDFLKNIGPTLQNITVPVRVTNPPGTVG